MLEPASDDVLLVRQAALQAGARRLLAHLDRTAIFAAVGSLQVTGSYVSGLMCWPDLDVGLLAGPGFSPGDALSLLRRAVDVLGVAAFDYRDERGSRCPTGATRDERYHLPMTLEHDDQTWRLDLSVWLHDPHTNVTAWHERLRESITTDQRRAVLRIKDVWHRLRSYPDLVGGMEIYTAVLEHGVRTPRQFADWLADRGLPST